MTEQKRGTALIKAKLGGFDQDLAKMKQEYRQVLPPHMDEHKLGRMVRNAVQAAKRKNGDNPLLDADRYTFWNSVMTVAALGLEVGNFLGQAYLIPFAGKVQPVPGYPGYITLAENSSISLQGVLYFENDTFNYQRGTSPALNHFPAYRS